MAVINCPECGHKISNKSNICIACGFPIKEYIDEQKAAEEARQEQEWAKAEKQEKEAVFQARFNSLADKRNVCILTKQANIVLDSGKLTLFTLHNEPIMDEIWNFSLEYFSISMGISCGLQINNYSKKYSTGIIDITCNGELKENLSLFKAIMQNNGLFVGRNRFDVLYKPNIAEKQILEDKRKKWRTSALQNPDFKGVYRNSWDGRLLEVYCPKCGSEDCSHFKEQQIVPRKTKTRYTININPFRPFTLLNKKEKVVRDEQLKTENKYMCNKCGYIFR